MQVKHLQTILTGPNAFHVKATVRPPTLGPPPTHLQLLASSSRNTPRLLLTPLTSLPRPTLRT